MDAEQTLARIKETYQEVLGDNLVVLIAGGSLPRGDFLPGWSDIDMFAVIRNVGTEDLRRVRKVEEVLSTELDTELDTMIVSEALFNATKPENLQDKVKNFLYWIDEEALLVGDAGRIPRVSFREYKKGTEVVCVEQSKKFLRRNVDIKSGNIEELRTLLKKNVKVTRLILRRGLATEDFAPNTWQQVLDAVEKRRTKEDWGIWEYERLLTYSQWRQKDAIKDLGKEELQEAIDSSVQYFERICAHILSHEEFLS